MFKDSARGMDEDCGILTSRESGRARKRLLKKQVYSIFRLPCGTAPRGASLPGEDIYCQTVQRYGLGSPTRGMCAADAAGCGSQLCPGLPVDASTFPLPFETL